MRTAAQTPPTIDDYVVYSDMTQRLHQIKLPDGKTWDACDHNLNVVVAFDVANSMNGVLNDTFQDAWKRMIEQFFCPGDVFTVIPFAHEVCKDDQIGHAEYTAKDQKTEADIHGLFRHTPSVNLAPGATFYRAQQKLLAEALHQRQIDRNRACLAIMIVDQERQGEQEEDRDGKIRQDRDNKLKLFTGGMSQFQEKDWKLLGTKGTPLRLYMYYAISGGDTPVASPQPDRRLVERATTTPETSSGLNNLLDNDTSTVQPAYGWCVLALALLLAAVAWLALQRYEILMEFQTGMLPGGGEPKRALKIHWWERISIRGILSPQIQDKEDKQYRLWVHLPYAEASEVELLRIAIGIAYVGNLPVIGCRISKVEHPGKWIFLKREGHEISTVDVPFGGTETVQTGFQEDNLRPITLKPRRMAPRPFFLSVPIALCLFSLLSFAAFQHSKAPLSEAQNTLPPSPPAGPASTPLCPGK
jgi:hypothetical protein